MSELRWNELRTIAWADDGTAHHLGSVVVTLGREMFLGWSVDYDYPDDSGDPRPVHRVGGCAGYSPSPFHAGRKLRSLRVSP